MMSPDSTVDQAGAPTDEARAAFTAFRDDPAERFRVRLLRTRAEQVRALLRDPDRLDLDSFNRQVLSRGAGTMLRGEEVGTWILEGRIDPARAAELEAALDSGELQLNGNYLFDNWSARFAHMDPSLDDRGRIDLIRQAIRILHDPALPPVGRVERIISDLQSLGQVTASGLGMLLYPNEVPCRTRKAREAVRVLGFRHSGYGPFARAAYTLREQVGADDFLELHRFLEWYSMRLERNRGESATDRFARFRGNPDNRLRVRARRERSAQIRELLSDPDKVDLEAFDREVWRIGTVTLLPAEDVTRRFLSVDPIEAAERERLEAALSAGRLRFGGNLIWRAATNRYGVMLGTDEQRQAGLGRMLEIWNDSARTPLERAQQLQEVPGLGRNTATGLVLLAHPTEFALYNEVSQAAVEKLGRPARTLEEFQASAHALLTELGAEDFLELDLFLWQLNESSPAQQRWWWVNQGTSYEEERDGGFIHAPGARDDGARLHHWSSVGKMQPGDRVVHYFRGVQAISEIRGTPRKNVRPDGTDRPLGFMVETEYQELPRVVPLDSIPRDLRVREGGPFNHSGGVKQGYCFPLSPGFAEQLQDILDLDGGNSTVRRQAPLASAISTESDPEPEPEYMAPSFEEIEQAISGQRLRIDRQTLRRYHLALGTRGFVILSGISGTGKTWLAQAYAQAVDAECLVVPVAPNWTTNEDLLGYFSPVDGRYHDTPFSRFLRRAAESYQQAVKEGRTPRPFHLVLDEMNLARVEYYFAQFLSAMELRSRAGIAVLHLGPETVVLPPSLRFVGTVNVDETTHAFADKVYDRAQLIELGAPRDALDAHLGDAEYRETLMRVWDVVGPVAPFGFRVLDEIRLYVEAARSMEVGWQEALDEQLLQKVLPKLKGTDHRLGAALAGLLEGLDPLRYPLTSAKASQMHASFQQHGFASYFQA